MAVEMAKFTTTITYTRIGESTSPSPFHFQSKAEQELLLTYINAMHKMNPALLHNFAAAAAAASATTTNDKREAADAASASCRSPPTPPPPSAPRSSTMPLPSNRRMVSDCTVVVPLFFDG